MVRSMLLDVLFLVVSVTTLCQGARIVISAIPSTISQVVTPTFTIRCALEDNGGPVRPISRVSSILIRKDEDSTQKEVARISTGQAAVAGPGATGALVSGDLSNKLGHLEVTWSPARHTQSGSYNCEIVAVNADGINLKFKSDIQVDSAGPCDNCLSKHVGQNREDIRALRKTVSDLETNVTQWEQKALAECKSQIDDLRTVVNGLRTDISALSSTHNEEGGVLFQNSDTWGETGPREKMLEVGFSTPYTNIPLLDYSVTMVDMDQARNTRYNIFTRDLTTTGFKLVCFTWADTHIYQIYVRWTSRLR